MSKTQKVRGRNVDLGMLAMRISTYLEDNEFETSTSKDNSESVPWFLVQARKTGKVRTISGMRRSIDILIKGNPDDFEVELGTGEWGKNLLISSSLAVVATFGLALPAVAGVAWMGRRFANSLWGHILEQIDYLSNSGTVVTSISQNQSEEGNTHTYADSPTQQTYYNGRYCTRCGNSLSEGANFCSSCGQRQLETQYAS